MIVKPQRNSFTRHTTKLPLKSIMNTQALKRASILGKANYLFSRQRKNSLKIVEARKSESRCYPRTISTFSYSSMAEQGGSGKSKSPEDLKKDIDQLIGKAQNIVTDMMNPQVQEELKKRILQTTEQNLSQALTEFQKVMKNVQDDVIVKSDANLAKRQVDIEQFKRDLDSVVRSLADPVVLQKFIGTFRPPSAIGGIDISNCREITKEEFEAGRNSNRNKAYYMRKRWQQQSIECKLNEATGKEECRNVEEEQTSYYECEPPK